MCLARSRMMCLCYAYRQCIFDTSVILYAHSPLRTANPLHVSIRYKTPYNSCGPWSSLQTLGGHAIFFLPRYPAINSIQLFFGRHPMAGIHSRPLSQCLRSIVSYHQSCCHDTYSTTLLGYVAKLERFKVIKAAKSPTCVRATQPCA